MTQRATSFLLAAALVSAVTLGAQDSPAEASRAAASITRARVALDHARATQPEAPAALGRLDRAQRELDNAALMQERGQHHNAELHARRALSAVADATARAIRAEAGR